MDNFLYYINDCFVTEAHFWNAVQGMIRPEQITKLFNGERLVVGGISYQIRQKI